MPLQIKFIEDKINHFKQIIYCLQKEIEEIKISPEEKVQARRENHRKVKNTAYYSTSLEISKEKLQEKITNKNNG